MMGCWVTCRFQKTISYENQSATELSKRGKKTAKKLPKIPLTMVWSGGKNKPSFRENQSANPIEVGQADKWYAAGKGVHQTFYWPSLDQLQSTPWGGGGYCEALGRSRASNLQLPQTQQKCLLFHTAEAAGRVEEDQPTAPVATGPEERSRKAGGPSKAVEGWGQSAWHGFCHHSQV